MICSVRTGRAALFPGEEDGTAVNDLSIGISGVMSIEQIMFNKIFLFSSIYNHHKIEAVDCMFRGVFEYIHENKLKIKINSKKFDFESPISFLKFSEYDFYALADFEDDHVLSMMVKNILNRNLLKRAVIINESTAGMPNEEYLLFVDTLANRTDQSINLREMVRDIVDGTSIDCSLHEIWIDIPKEPNLGNGKNTFVRVYKGDNERFEPISNFFPIPQFGDLYRNNKRSFYVLCPEQYLQKVATATKVYFKEKLNVDLKESAFPYGTLD
ncbi:MAG: hypothetical protein ACPKOP_04135 [Sphaerochaetaceae bacterium]